MIVQYPDSTVDVRTVSQSVVVTAPAMIQVKVATVATVDTGTVSYSAAPALVRWSQTGQVEGRLYSTLL